MRVCISEVHWRLEIREHNDLAAVGMDFSVMSLRHESDALAFRWGHWRFGALKLQMCRCFRRDEGSRQGLREENAAQSRAAFCPAGRTSAGAGVRQGGRLMGTQGASFDSLSRLIAWLWPQGDKQKGNQVYIFLEGARDGAIEEIVRLERLEFDHQYHGKLAPRLQSAVPCLVQLAAPPAQPSALLDWGLHFRSFDLRALRSFLRSCSTDHLRALCGPLRSMQAYPQFPHPGPLGGQYAESWFSLQCDPAVAALTRWHRHANLRATRDWIGRGLAGARWVILIALPHQLQERRICC